MTMPEGPAGSGFAQWSGNVSETRARQAELALQVTLKDAFAKPLRTVAGLDVGFEDDGATTRAAAVLMDAVTLQPIAMEAARVPAAVPYVPGLLAFSQLPALLAAVERLPRPPDLVFVHGHGIAHPRRLGIAALFGVATGLPSIGVADTVCIGEGIVPHPTRGAYTALRDRREQIGWLLRSQVDCRPLVVSPGHRVAMASAADLVMRHVASDRLPEPIRLAQRLVTRSGTR